LNAVRRFGVARLAAVLGVSIGAAAVLAAVLLRTGAEPDSLLYSNLDVREAASITQALDEARVKYSVRGDGTTIMVARDEVASTRLLLSSKGLPTSGSVGYEIFDAPNTLGQTDFVQNLNRQRALEGELARTIRGIQGLTSARVHLVLPKRQLFEPEAASPTASVFVGLAGRDLSAEQVVTIRNLVAGAVPGLKADAVTVADERGRTLAAGSEGQQTGFASQMIADRKAAEEARIRQAVRQIVEGVVGPGAARVEVTADLDLNRVTTQQEAFDPDGQVVRSTSTVEDNSRESTPGVDGLVTATANIPGGEDALGEASFAGSSSGRTEETTNYEISKTVRTEVVEPGAIKRLSVAVAVDGVTTTAANGRTTYAPRSAEQMRQIEQLVRSAVGFDSERGDQVSVVNVRFAQAAAAAAAGTAAGASMFAFDKNDIMRGVELGVLLAVALLIIFLVVRPMLKSIRGGGQEPGLALAAPSQASGATPQVTFVGGEPVPQLAAPDDGRIDIARIEGQVKASSVKKVAEFVEKHPDESVSILRSWLHEA
jgi:flagellar M-ring protein FliF